MRSGHAVGAALVVTLGVVLVASQSPAPTRRIDRQGGPIATQVRPGDRHVIVEDAGSDPPLIIGGPSEGETRLDWLSRQSDVIVVVRVEAIDSELAYRDVLSTRVAAADEANWIVSTAQTRLENIIKGADGLGKTIGERVTLMDDGGSLMIGGTLVEAVVPWKRAMVPGRRYLLFGHVFNGQLVTRYMYEESSSGRLAYLMRRPPAAPGFALPPDDVEYWQLDQAVWMIREAARR